MVARSVIILLASIVLVIAQIPPEFQANGYHRHPGPPLRVRQSGASKIFGWLGSRFAKIPYFLPRVPSFPKYAPQPQQESPQFQTVILPEPQSGDQFYKGEEYPPVLQEPNNYIESNPSYNVPDQSQNIVPVENKPDQFEVVPSHMVSYEKEVMAPVDGGWQPGYGGIPNSPIPSPPIYNNNPQGQVPIVPQSVGPDYFNTAYGNEDPTGSPQPQNTYHPSQEIQQTQQAQSGHQPQVNFQAPQSQPQQFQGQSYSQNNNLGATFGEIHQQLPQASYNLGSVSAPNGQHQANQQNGFQSTPMDLNQADFSTLLSSINPSGGGNDGFTVQSSQIVPLATKPPKKAQGSQSKQANGFVASGIPGVQILSQSEDGGNPVFEVLADADAPSFGGHPFDINKLIAMIEPGAELVDAPQLSESASETKNTYEEAPTTSGISDLLLSESQVEPSLTTVDGSKTKKPFSSFFSTSKNDSDKNKSSLKEIMEFFQQTGGKGYVVVEKKRSPLNLTDALTPDDDLTDGFSRLNITSETLPLLALDKEHDNSLKFGIIQHGSNTDFSKAKPTTSFPTKAYSFKPSGERKPFLPRVTRPPIKFENLTSPTVFFAVRATTQHPNHNYNSNSSFHFLKGNDESKAEIPTVNTLVDVVSRPILDSVTESPEYDDDLSADESSQVKVIAITVTPPPNLKSSSTSPTTPTLFSIPVTKKSVSSSVSSKKRPAPVYRPKIAKVSNNQTLT